MDTIEARTAALEQRIADLGAEVAGLRQVAALREEFIDAVDARAYTRGRQSVLGRPVGGRLIDESSIRRRHLRAVR